MTYSFGDISVWSRRILLNFCWFSIFFYILTANISWKVAQTPINPSIFWKSVMRTFRCIYVYCFNRHRFLAQVSTKLRKETWILDKWPHFCIYFFRSTCFVTFIFVFESSQNSFSCGFPLVFSGLVILAKSYRFVQPIILF